MPKLRNTARDRRFPRPTVNSDMRGSWESVGWFRLRRLAAGLLVEWQRDGDEPREALFDQLVEDSLLASARQDVGTLIADILQQYINDMMVRIPDPNAAMNYLSYERQQLSVWRKWADFKMPIGFPSRLAPIDEDKLTAYRATHYRVFNDGNLFTLRIGVRSEELATIYRDTNMECAVFITAFNPYGSQQSREVNIAANARLREYLESLFPLVLEGDGADPTGAWPPEPSFLAVGVNEATARRIGKRVRQDAVIWCGADTIPNLIFTR